MRILLVQADIGRKEPMLVYPLGLACLGTVLQTKGHELTGYDPNASPEELVGLKKKINEFSPQIIGISLRNIDNQLRSGIFYYYRFFQKTLRTARSCTSEAKIIGGGAGFSIFAEQIMKRNPELDFGVHLEGEESFPELLEQLETPQAVKGIFYRKDNDVIFTGARKLPDFENLPYPKREIFQIENYLHDIQCIGIQTKRGCPLKCTYCTYPLLNGNKLRMRSVESVCDELTYLIDTFNIKRFIFADAVFNMPKKHAETICEEIIKRGINIEWAAYMNIKNSDRDFLMLAKKAGCRDIVFSPDAISNGALKCLKKGLEEKDIRESLDLFIKDKEMRDFNVIYSFFLNAPGETLSGLLKTILFYCKAKWTLRGRGTAFMNWIRLEPGTVVFQKAIEEGAIPNDIELLPDDEAGLAKVFYSKPSLSWLDPFLFFLLKLPSFIKTIAKGFGLKKTDGEAHE